MDSPNSLHAQESPLLSPVMSPSSSFAVAGQYANLPHDRLCIGLSSPLSSCDDGVMDSPTSLLLDDPSLSSSGFVEDLPSDIAPSFAVVTPTFTDATPVFPPGWRSLSESLPEQLEPDPIGIEFDDKELMLMPPLIPDHPAAFEPRAHHQHHDYHHPSFANFDWSIVTDVIRRRKIERWKKKRDRIRSGQTTKHVYDVRVQHAIRRPRTGGRFISKIRSEAGSTGMAIL